jgi:hypothetical protein
MQFAEELEQCPELTVSSNLTQHHTFLGDGCQPTAHLLFDIDDGCAYQLILSSM